MIEAIVTLSLRYKHRAASLNLLLLNGLSVLLDVLTRTGSLLHIKLRLALLLAIERLFVADSASHYNVCDRTLFFVVPRPRSYHLLSRELLNVGLVASFDRLSTLEPVLSRLEAHFIIRSSLGLDCFRGEG